MDIVRIAGVVTETSKASLIDAKPGLADGEALVDGIHIKTAVDLKVGYYAEIYAEAGNRRTEYSTVYPIFYLRGYDVVETDQWLWGYRDLNRISDNKINTEFSVEFYPLSNDQADYNGMVSKYKDYLLHLTI